MHTHPRLSKWLKQTGELRTFKFLQGSLLEQTQGMKIKESRVSTAHVIVYTKTYKCLQKWYGLN